MSNLQQLTMAWLMYAGDNKGHFCSAEMQYIGPGQPANMPSYTLAGVPPLYLPKFLWTWMARDAAGQNFSGGVLWPYLQNGQVYYCPDDPYLPNSIYIINGLLAGQT